MATQAIATTKKAVDHDASDMSMVLWIVGGTRDLLKAL